MELEILDCEEQEELVRLAGEMKLFRFGEWIEKPAAEAVRRRRVVAVASFIFIYLVYKLIMVGKMTELF
jgi:hypothetical protein